MTREEKQKAIDALKISAPVMAVTQEEFNDYIHTLNQVMDWLEQEPKCESCELNRQRFMQTLDVAFELGKISAEPYKGMTNGKVIKAVFPNTKIITQYDNSFGDRFMVFELDNKMSQEVYLDWWNSPYEPQESEDKK